MSAINPYETFAIICVFLQFLGAILLIYFVSPHKASLRQEYCLKIAIAICGLAATIKIFLPIKSWRSDLTYIAGICGFIIFVLMIYSLKKKSAK